MNNRAPYVYFGGKRTVAGEIWRRLGDPMNFVDPFLGSNAVLLARPGWDWQAGDWADQRNRIETVNDADGMVCLGPDTLLLSHDLHWVPAGDIRVGDELMGFDEFNGEARVGLRAPKHYRHWCITKVTNVCHIKRPAYRLIFDDGTQVIASSEHQWLSGSHQTGGRGWRWIRTDRLISNRKNQRSWILRLCGVTNCLETYEAGWLGGFCDGEANLKKGPGWGLTITQREGPDIMRAEEILKRHNFQFSYSSPKRQNPNHSKMCNLVLRGGIMEVLRFLMLFRPERLIRNARYFMPQHSLYGRKHQAVGLIGKEFLGDMDVCAIETDSHTFVAEGLASHNCNFWRAIAADPEKTAHYADWPILESDLHARHAWLVGKKEGLAARLEGDPDWYDVKIAGWWCWGMCAWIGSGFCAGVGPWHVEDGKLVNGGTGGIWRQLPHLSGAGQGINRKRPRLDGYGENGVNAVADIYSWFAALSARLRRVRVCCGDWSRVMGPMPTYLHGLTGIILDPPYSGALRDRDIYATDSDDVAIAVREWALANGDNPLLRLALCGYQGEHQMPGWSVYRWTAGGGYGLQGKGRGRDNREKEVVWFNSHCLDVELAQQGELFDSKGENHA